MTNRKLRTFEEKINAFLKSFESSSLRHQTKEYFLERYSYLQEEEVEKLLTLCKEIEEMAYQLACKVTQKSNMPIETQRSTMQAAIQKKYPYLEEIRVYRLISRKLYWVNH